MTGIERNFRIGIRPPETCRPNPQSAGFTLIEMLVAFAILAAGLTLLSVIYGDTTARSAQSQSEAAAATVARGLLGRVGTDLTLADGVISGTESGCSWRIMISPYGDDADRANWPTPAHRVQVLIAWRDAGRRRAFTLETIRLGGTP